MRDTLCTCPRLSENSPVPRVGVTLSKQTLQVLLVEDDPVAAGVLEAQLSADFFNRFESILAGSLEAAIERLRSGSFDVIVLDLLLPDARGLEALHALVDHGFDTPIVVLTSLDDEEVAAKALQQGAQDYLVKGELHGRLVARSIRYAVERNRLTQALRGLALIDEHTGLYNRRGFSNLAGQTLNNARRRGQGVALISVVLEDPPERGSELESGVVRPAMRRLASLLRDTFRASDLLARISEREFIVLAIQAAREGAKVAVARFEKSLGNGSSTAPRYPIQIGLDWIRSEDLPAADALPGVEAGGLSALPGEVPTPTQCARAVSDSTCRNLYLSWPCHTSTRKGSRWVAHAGEQGHEQHQHP